jgi:hypothetical protein
MMRFLRALWAAIRHPFKTIRGLFVSPAVMSSDSETEQIQAVEPDQVLVPEVIANAFRDVDAKLRHEARQIVKGMGTFTKKQYHKLVDETYETLKNGMFANAMELVTA